MAEEPQTCHVCQRTDTLAYNVCGCNNYVHKKCLDNWRHQQSRDAYALPFLNNFRGVQSCGICGYEYRVSVFPPEARSQRRHLTPDEHQKLKSKYKWLMLWDATIFFAILFGLYFFFGWLVPPIIKEPHTNGMKFLNGIIWTHFIIGVLVLISAIARCRTGGVYFCYCNSGPSCNGNGNELLGIVIVLILAVIGIIVPVALVFTEITKKRRLQQDSEMYWLSQTNNPLDTILLD